VPDAVILSLTSSSGLFSALPGGQKFCPIGQNFLALAEFGQKKTVGRIFLAQAE